MGTLAPTETGEYLPRVRRLGKVRLNGYLSAGPVISGGPIDILGWTTTYQAMAKSRVMAAVPLTGTWIMELGFRWEMLLLHENATARDRHRGGFRISFAAVRDAGAFTVFFGRRLMDTWIDRTQPVSWYLGISHRF
jgi:hypothetical protein